MQPARPPRRYRLANHVHGLPFDPPRWGEPPRLRRKSTMSQGRDTRVAVLDSGVSAHPWLAGSFAETPLPADALDGWDMSAPGLPRHVGHGTFVAGLVLQYAPAVTLLPRRVIDAAGDANDADLARVIRDLIALDPDVVNLSLGPVPPDEPGTIDEGTQQTIDAVRDLQDTCGTVVVVAAGNSEERCPAEHLASDSDLTVVVGALDLGGEPAWFSNTDPVHLWAPGVDVLSSFLHWDGPVGMEHPGEHEHQAEPHQHRSAAPERPVAPFAGWARWNGTSFAAPAVAGAIAAEISAISGAETAKERRRQGLLRVLDAGRDIDIGHRSGKAKALAATPVALEGPPLPRQRS